MSRLITLKKVHDVMNQKRRALPATALRIKVFKGKYFFETHPTLYTSSKRHMVHSFSNLESILSTLDVIEPNH